MQFEDQSLHIKLVDLPNVHQKAGDVSMWDSQHLKEAFVTQGNTFEVMASNRARAKLE
jgi:hypothetical protein